MAEIANLNTRLSLESASFLSGVEKSRGALRSLISSLDPVAAATARYNRQVQLLEGGMKRGQLTAEQHGLALQRLNARYQEQIRSQGAVTGSTGMMRSGMQQLSFQVGDVATQFASGTRPMIIFAQQGGQVIQAIQMMTNSSKGFLGFLGGPWGQIITAATVVLAALSSKLFDNADAADAAADGADNYTEALKRLQDQAGAFSFGSAEFSKVNKDLLEAEARVGRLRQEMADAPIGGPTIITPGGTATGQMVRSRSVVQRELEAASAARDSLRGDMRVLLMQRQNREIADRREPRERKTRTPPDRSDQREERFDDQLARLRHEQLNLQLAITSDIRYRANIQRDQVEAELRAYEEDLKHQVAQKEITSERAKELLTLKERNTDLELTRINRSLDAQITQEEIDLARSALDIRNAEREGALEAARTQAERRRIQLQILEAETATAREAIKQQLLAKDLSDTARQLLNDRLALLNVDTANRRSAIERGTMGDMARYLDSLPRSALELNEAYERVAAEGLASVSDGLADVITGARSMGDVFADVADQIISDLARIAVQKYITAPLASALFGGPSAISDPGSGFSAMVNALTDPPRMANGGRLRVGGLPGIDRNLLSINGMPRALVSADETVHVTPSNDNGSRGRGVVINQHNNFAGGAVTHDDLARVAMVTKAATMAAMGDRNRRAP